MSEDELRKLKEDYKTIEPPEKLNLIVKKEIKKQKHYLLAKNVSLTFASLCFVFVLLVNYSTVFAKEIESIPVIKNIANFVSFKKYSLADDKRHIDVSIDSAKLDGLVNEELQSYLNNKYLNEATKLYDDFMNEVEINNNSVVNKGIDANYSIEVSNDNILVIKQIITKTAASSEQIANYDTIDRKNQILITLPSLFKNDKYIDVISDNLKDQMIKQMKQDSTKVYDLEVFDKIGKNQKFYISNNNKLIVVFDSYSISPGFMGLASFEIPSNILKDILVSNYYIK